MVSANHIDLPGPGDTPGIFQRYATERRLVADHPLTGAVLRHGGRTLQSIARLRLRGTPGSATVAAFDDLESLTYRLAAKTHRTVAAVLRLEIAPDDASAAQELRVTTGIVRGLLREMCQGWTAIFLEAPPDGPLIEELRRGFADVEQHLSALTRKTPGNASSAAG